LGILAVATIACLAPFINKAFCIDDPLFLWAAAQIQAHPLDFYGCDVNWYGTVQPLYDVMKNPPLACYYLAAMIALVGTSEPALHAAYLLPTIGAIWGTWFLARSFCRQPISAALVALVTPAFLVSSSNLMCDTMMVCLWTWAIALWIRGLNTAKSGWLAVASVLIFAAAVTKYFAISLIPLLAVFTILREHRPTWRLAWLLVPTALLAGYQWWTWRQYGRGLLSDAAAFAWQIAVIPGPGTVVSQETVGSKTVAGLSFLGGSFIALLFCAPWLWSKRGLAAALVVAVAIGAWARWLSSSQQLIALHMEPKFTSTLATALGLFVLGGALVLWLAMRDIVKHESPDACLLALWVWGTFGFAAFVNWTCNVRSMLPIAPALGILLVRRIDEERTRRGRSTVAWRWALVPAAAVALLVAWADFCLANSARTAATQIAALFRPEEGTVWFQGHWGFQYYMRAKGVRDVDLGHPSFQPGDILINPFNNTDVFFFAEKFLDPLREMEFPACGWLSTMRASSGAGFYSAIWGPLPYAVAPAPSEKYGVWRLKVPVELKPLLKDEG
jgi:hypothetical protein